MSGKERTATSRPTSGPADRPLLPCLLLRKGQVCLPSDDGPIAARNPAGQPLDPFEVVDQLVRSYPIVYVVDLDGIEKGDPQLDYLQELSRDATIWVDAGVRTSDQAIDVLVAGASKAILSSATIAGPREIRRAWRLSTDLAFELELSDQGPRLRGEWPVTSAREVAALARETGLTDLVVSPRGVEVDWSLVQDLGRAGPVWVDGSFDPSDKARLAEAGASGGIFHLSGLFGAPSEPLPSLGTPLSQRGAR